MLRRQPASPGDITVARLPSLRPFFAAAAPVCVHGAQQVLMVLALPQMPRLVPAACPEALFATLARLFTAPFSQLPFCMRKK